MNKSELASVMFNWRIQVSNQWHVRKDHVPLCLTIQLAFDCDWRSSVQGANDPNAYTSQKLVCEATLHLARFNTTEFIRFSTNAFSKVNIFLLNQGDEKIAVCQLPLYRKVTADTNA